MYKIKKNYDIPDIEVPACMYRVKPLESTGQQTQLNTHVHNGNPDSVGHQSQQSPSVKKTDATKQKRSRSPLASKSSNSNTVIQMDTSDDKLSNVNETSAGRSRYTMIQELESRQQEIIRRLLSLRDKLNTMTHQCQNLSTPVVETTSNVRKSLDVVVNADPEKPPYSVLLLVKLLKESYGSSIILRSHVHSSCRDSLATQLSLFNQDPNASKSGTGETITILVIWKKLTDKEPQLLVESNQLTPIRGESNVAKYLSRLLPTVHSMNYGTLNWDDICKVDGILMKGGDYLTDFKILENQLGQSTPFLFGEPSLADYVMFSRVVPHVSTYKIKSGQFPRVFQWLNACQQLGAFSLSL